MMDLLRRLAGKHVHAREPVGEVRAEIRGMVRTYYTCQQCDVIWYEEKAI